jgi:hypothetical protein
MRNMLRVVIITALGIMNTALCWGAGAWVLLAFNA